MTSGAAMTSLQRKRVAREDTSDDETHLDDERLVIQTEDSAANDSDPARDPSHKSKTGKKISNAKAKKRVVSNAASRGIRSCFSAGTVVLLGLVWCALVFLMMRSLWLYQNVVSPLEKALGKQKAEAEAVVVVLGVAVPFVLSGLVFHWRSPRPLQFKRGSSSIVFQYLRSLRRTYVSPHFDSVDVVVIAAFAIVQMSTLVGKLMIDDFNGKIAKSGFLDRFSRSLGMNGLYGMVLSILLVARRSFVHQYIGLSSERAARYHVWCGNFAVITLTAHGVLYMFCWTQQGKLVEKLIPCMDCSSEKQAYGTRRNFSGLVAQVFLLIVALGSLERVRRNRFRWFTWTHCVNAAFVVFTGLHYYPTVYWLIPVFIVYVMYRVLSVFTRVTSGIVAMKTIGDNFVQLGLTRDKTPHMDYLPGQYVYIKVNQIANNEWHPISISSSPLRSSTALTLDIKVEGSFTKQLYNLAEAKTLQNVQMDGYYGTGIEIGSSMVFVAGGSGMTPFLSMLEHLWILAQRHEAERGRLPKRLWIVWTARDYSFIQAHADLLNRIQSCDAWKCEISLHCTGMMAPEDDRNISSSGVNNEVLPPTTSLLSGSATVSMTKLFTSVVIGGALAMAFVFSWTPVAQVWWLKRLLLLGGGLLGATAGGSWMMYHSMQRPGGFEPVASNEVSDKSSLHLTSSSELSSEKILERLHLDTSRPDIEKRLYAIHNELEEDVDTIRILVSGPSSLLEAVSLHSTPFSRPFFAVESRSFTL